ncbi:MAG: biotin/lipoyl-containing protein [bacterium]
MGQENIKNSQNGSSLEDIQELYDFMCDEALDELEISRKGYSVKMVRNARSIIQHVHGPILSNSPESKEQKEEPSQKAGEKILAPLIGTFYRSPSPKSSSFVNQGDKVDPGSTLCILEAMKVMNEIKADRYCEILEIVAENGKMVKKDDVLFLIKYL